MTILTILLLAISIGLLTSTSYIMAQLLQYNPLFNDQYRQHIASQVVGGQIHDRIFFLRTVWVWVDDQSYHKLTNFPTDRILPWGRRHYTYCRLRAQDAQMLNNCARAENIRYEAWSHVYKDFNRVGHWIFQTWQRSGFGSESCTEQLHCEPFLNPGLCFGIHCRAY